jgi:hypothetical protein
VLTTANAAETNDLTNLRKHEGARDNKFLVTHPMTNQRCLTSAIARRSALTVGPWSSSFKIIMEEEEENSIDVENYPVMGTYQRQWRNEVVYIRLFRGFYNFVVGDFTTVIAISDVFADGSVEKDWFLLYESDCCPRIF